MKLKIWIYFLFSSQFLSGLFLNAQNVFKKNYSWTFEQNAKKVIVTSDSNFVVVTTTGANGGNQAIISIIKINQKGDSLWIHDAFMNYDANLYSIRECSNHDLLLSGTTASDSLPGNDIWLLKINSTGNPIWFNIIPSQAIIWDIDGMEVSSSGIIHLCAHSSNTGEHIISTDSLGNLIKWLSLNHTIYFERGSLLQQPNGKINFLGHRLITSFANREIRIFNISSLGDTSNSRLLFKTDSIYGPGDCFFDSSYNLNFFGNIAPNNLNCLARYDTLGNLLILKKFKGLDYYGTTYSIESLSGCNDGGYILSGSKVANPFSTKYNGFLFRFDANGDSIWLNRFYGGNTKTIFRDAKQAKDGGFIAVGFEEYPNFLIQAVVYKTDTLGLMLPSFTYENSIEENYLHLFPNPARERTTVHYSGKKATAIHIYNLQGEEVKHEIIASNSQTNVAASLSLSELPPGFYFCQIKNAESVLAVKKLIVVQ